jgi:RHS repeat-associated protein
MCPWLEFPYAYQRYYTSGLGRFLTADPFDGSASPSSPQTWNRYPYAGSDPTNNNDPSGLDCGGIQNWQGGGCGPGLGEYGDGDNWQYMGGGYGGYEDGGCVVGSDGFLESPIDGYPCDGSDPEPQTPKPAASCKMTVVGSGVPLGQAVRGLTTYAPTQNRLGAYSTDRNVRVPPAQWGWFFALQVRTTLSGDTDAGDWQAAQTMSVVGALFVDIDVNGDIQSEVVPVNRSLGAPQESPQPGAMYQGAGLFYWLDLVGQGMFLGGGTVVGGDLTFTGTSTLTDINSAFNAAPCSARWSLKLSFTPNGVGGMSAISGITLP